MGTCSEHQATIYAEMFLWQEQVVFRMFLNILLSFDTGTQNRSVQYVVLCSIHKSKILIVHVLVVKNLMPALLSAQHG